MPHVSKQPKHTLKRPRFRAASSFFQAAAIPAIIAALIALVFAGEYVLSSLMDALGR
ncbi:MAG: hypothetical protein M3498_11505 [Deinococcota bacterium]|jgi:hypothetical protein|nr:hypothetical protein [Deinococcota bacterium]